MISFFLSAVASSQACGSSSKFRTRRYSSRRRELKPSSKSTVFLMNGFLTSRGKDGLLVTQVTSPWRARRTDVVRTTSPRAPILMMRILSKFFQVFVREVVFDGAFQVGNFFHNPGRVAVGQGEGGDVF